MSNCLHFLHVPCSFLKIYSWNAQFFLVIIFFAIIFTNIISIPVLFAIRNLWIRRKGPTQIISSLLWNVHEQEEWREVSQVFMDITKEQHSHSMTANIKIRTFCSVTDNSMVFCNCWKPLLTSNLTKSTCATFTITEMFFLGPLL